MSPKPRRLAEKLKMIRETLAQSREAMARQLDVEVSDIGRFESGEDPSLLILLHYSRIGRLSLESLVDDQMDAVVGSLQPKPAKKSRSFREFDEKDFI
jgi:transcriptional regulator with XRE-family HTH domain